jgi:type IV pilus assembly protein PilA
MNLRGDGFSMMEILVVIAIVAILATLAVPSYLDKIVRDQIVEALPLADIAKSPLAGSWTALQTFPTDNAAAGLPAPDKIVNNFVSSVLVRSGAIDLTFGNRASGAIKGKVLTLRAAVVEDAPRSVTWVCGYTKAPDKMTVRARTTPACRAICRSGCRKAWHPSSFGARTWVNTCAFRRPPRAFAVRLSIHWLPESPP